MSSHDIGRTCGRAKPRVRRITGTIHKGRGVVRGITSRVPGFLRFGRAERFFIVLAAIALGLAPAPQARDRIFPAFPSHAAPYWNVHLLVTQDTISARTLEDSAVLIIRARDTIFTNLTGERFPVSELRLLRAMIPEAIRGMVWKGLSNDSAHLVITLENDAMEREFVGIDLPAGPIRKVYQITDEQGGEETGFKGPGKLGTGVLLILGGALVGGGIGAYQGSKNGDGSIPGSGAGFGMLLGMAGGTAVGLVLAIRMSFED